MFTTCTEIQAPYQLTFNRDSHNNRGPIVILKTIDNVITAFAYSVHLHGLAWLELEDELGHRPVDITCFDRVKSLVDAIVQSLPYQVILLSACAPGLGNHTDSPADFMC